MASLQSSFHERALKEVPPYSLITVGEYLGRRLCQVEANTFFTVPGDFILGLLDDLIKQPQLRMVGCCNELNAGYAADGYCRATGNMAVAVVTYCVGGLSIINAAAGSYSDDLPVLIVSGGPNTNDQHQRHLVHHTIGEAELGQCSAAFKPVVKRTFVINHIRDAAQQIDDAISCCLNERKPVYLEIACNLTKALLPEPSPMAMLGIR